MSDADVPKTLTLLAPSTRTSTERSLVWDGSTSRRVGRAADMDLARFTGLLNAATFDQDGGYLQQAIDSVLDEMLQSFDETTMARLQSRLRDNDKILARHLAHVIRNTVLARSFTSEERSFALETITAAKSPYFHDKCADLVRESMGCGEADLRFAAVAAFSDLQPAHRDRLRGILQTLEGGDDSDDVRRAARAAIRWADERRA